MLKYLPSYAPELNLIEILWRFLKYYWLPFLRIPLANVYGKRLKIFSPVLVRITRSPFRRLEYAKISVRILSRTLRRARQAHPGRHRLPGPGAEHSVEVVLTVLFSGTGVQPRWPAINLPGKGGKRHATWHAGPTRCLKAGEHCTRGSPPVAVVTGWRTGEAGEATRRVLFFTKSAEYEHEIVRRDSGRLGAAETALVQLGATHGFDVTASRRMGRSSTRIAAVRRLPLLYDRGCNPAW